AGAEGEASGLRLVVAAEPGVTEAELVECCRRAEGGGRLPLEVRFLPALPRTPAGKILRPRLAR
ncbi:MAG: fatty acid--CoA ligase, partial [Clostridia bacterium]|nr:fatty acid--CoA ligase [Clostridia bacterium]